MSHIHIPDGVLPAWLWIGGWVLTFVAIGIATRLARRYDLRRTVPLIGVISALMIVAMSTEIVPLAYHVNLTVISGILLGPIMSVVAAFIVGVVLAMFGHGGVTVLGLNTLIMTAEMVIGWALFRSLIKLIGRRPAVATGITTVFTLALTTTALVGIVWLSGTTTATQRETGALDPTTLDFSNPFSKGIFTFNPLHSKDHEHEHDEHESYDAEEPSLSVKRFATVVYTLGPIGWLIEALISAAIIGYVARVRPVLVYSGALAETTHTIPGDETGRH